MVVKAKLRRRKKRNGCIKGKKQQRLIKEKMNEYRKKTNQQKYKMKIGFHPIVVGEKMSIQ